MSARQQLGFLWSIALSAFGGRAIWLVRAGGDWLTTPDSLGYVALAEGLLHRCGFAMWVGGSCGPPETLRTPGYPLLLAVLALNWRTVLVTQAMFGGLLVLAVGLFVRRHFGFRAAVISALLLATDVPSVLVTKQLLSDAFFQFVLGAGVLILMSAALTEARASVGLAKTAIGGLAIAAACLIRPVGEVLVPFLWLPFIVGSAAPRRRILLGITAVITSASLLFCWAARNRALGDAWTLSTDGAFAAYYYATPPLLRDGAHSHVQITTIRHALVSRLVPTTDNGYAAVPGSIGEPDYDLLLSITERHPSLGSSMYRTFFTTAFLHPLDEAAICAGGFLRLAFWPYSPGLGLRGLMRGESAGTTLPVPRNRQTAFHLIVFITLVFQTMWLAVAWLGALVAFTRALRSQGREQRSVALTLCVFTVLLLAAPAPFFGARDLRYRTPMVPFLAIVAAMGWMRKAPSITAP